MDYKLLGKRIKEERNRLNILQDVFAKDIFISPSYLSLIESGDRSLTIETLLAISNRLDVTIDYLLRDSKLVEENNVLSNHIEGIISKLNENEKQLLLKLLSIITELCQ